MGRRVSNASGKASRQGAAPQGHGYAIREVDRDNPFYAVGIVLRGHEFHCSRVFPGPSRRRPAQSAADSGRRDGIVRGSVRAGYTAIRTSDAVATPEWAQGILRTHSGLRAYTGTDPRQPAEVIA